MRGLYYEEFSVGMRFEHTLTRTVTEWDNVQFSTMTMNPQPLHIDAHYSSGTEFGQPLVNSLFTLGLMIGISVGDTTLRTTIANLGMREIAFPAPVFQGDTLSVITEVVAMRASASRPNAGIVEFLHLAYNQKGTEVARCTRSALMHREPTI
ncbi:MAG: MaoC family dehydratase [Burkholderiaceae bacterium]|nr:MaoC family dehydratase [Burkholderiaceae bacterium]